MSTRTVYCHILEGDVTVTSDLNGIVTNVVCPQFVRFTHGCMKKNSNLGFWQMGLAKVIDGVTDSRISYCEFGDPKHREHERQARRQK